MIPQHAVDKDSDFGLNFVVCRSQTYRPYEGTRVPFTGHEHAVAMLGPLVPTKGNIRLVP